jgi:hypothetical protein
MHLHYKGNLLILFREITDVYTQNHRKHINTLCEQNAEILNGRAGVTYRYDGLVKSQYLRLHCGINIR